MGITVRREKGTLPAFRFSNERLNSTRISPWRMPGCRCSTEILGNRRWRWNMQPRPTSCATGSPNGRNCVSPATYFHATGEVEKEAQTYELWTANYPRDYVPHGNLGANYSTMGQYEKALAEFQEALRLAPDNVGGYGNLGVTYLNLNRLDEAKAAFDQALARKLDERISAGEHVLSCLSAGRCGADGAAGGLGCGQARRRRPAALGAIRYRSLLRAAEQGAGLFPPGGGLGRPRRLQRNGGFVAGQCRAARGGDGQHASARQGVTAALALSPGRDVKVVAALALARIGDAPRAKALAEELEKSYPTNTLLKLYWLPTINAAIELNKSNSSASSGGSGGRRALRTGHARHSSIPVPGVCARPSLPAGAQRQQPQPPSSRSCWITEVSW